MNQPTQPRLAAIVSADVVGYSQIMNVDKVAMLAGLRTHRSELIDPKIAAPDGRMVKIMDDDLLLELPSVAELSKPSRAWNGSRKWADMAKA